MARKRKELPILENITITDVAAEGKALAKVNDMVIFVPYVVPGDVVDLKIKKKKHRYCEAEAIKFHQYSEKRATPNELKIIIITKRLSTESVFSIR